MDKPANPALQSYGDSDFATHVLISPDEAPISVIDVVHKVLSSIHRTKTELSAAELIRLGSVWYLSSCNVAKYGTYNPSSGVKPIRLTSPYAAIDNATADEDGKTNPLMLSVGDYLRIHHNPRRFRMVNDYDWSKFIDSDEVVDRGPDSEMLLTPETGKTKIEKDGVIVAADPSKGMIFLQMLVRCALSPRDQFRRSCVLIGRTTPVFDGCDSRLGNWAIRTDIVIRWCIGVWLCCLTPTMTRASRVDQPVKPKRRGTPSKLY